MTYGGKSASITGLTVGQKTLTWDVSGLSAKKPYDGTTAATVNGTLKVSGVLPGEDAQFSYTTLSGSYAGSAPGTERVTVTLTGAKVDNDNYILPTDAIKFNGYILGNMINLPPEEGSSEQLAISVEDGVNEVPDALKDKETLNTPAKIITALQVAANKQLPGGTYTIKDLEFWSKPAGATSWVRATEKFPAEGVKVDLPYSDVGLTYAQAQGMDFTVAQMLTKAGAAGAVGDIVATNFTLTSRGISFTLLSPAPVTIAYKAKPAPAAPAGTSEAPAATPAPTPVPTPGKFTVNAWVNVLAGGVVSPMGETAYAQGKNVTYTITPAAGYRVARVTVDGVDVGAVSSYTFSYLNRNHQIGVYFEKGTAAGAATATIPRTADDTPLAAWAMLMALAALTASTITMRRKKQK